MLRRYFIIIFLIALTITIGCSAESKETSGEGNFPKKDIEFIAPASPGGGWDSTARAMQKILIDEEIIEENISVINKPGGNGEDGWQFLKGKDAHVVAMNSSLIITNHLLDQSELTFEDFTPLAILTTEWPTVTISSESDLETGTDVMEQLKKDPKSLKIGVEPGLGSDAHLAFVQAAQEEDVDVSQLEYLIYDGGGDLVTALLGGHVDVAATELSKVKEHYLAEKFNIVAIASEERVKDLEDVQTWEEQGVDVIFPHWRGIIGPPNMSDEEINYWDEKMEEMAETEGWNEVLDNNEWETFYKSSSESKEFLAEQTEHYDELLKLSGLK